MRGFQGGQALFTQPAMPIKCAGAPQKAMYLACDHWLRTGVLGRAQVQFDLAGAALFGVPTFVPPLMRYVERYGIALNFNSTLVAVDGPARKAWFDVKNAEGQVSRVEKDFDMLHAVPPQLPHDFVRNSPLADAAGWCEVDPATLRHPRYANVFGLGDTISASNAKTAAAAQADRGGGREPDRLPGRLCHAGEVRRLRLLPADGRARPHRAGRVRLRRQAAAHLPAGSDRAAQERVVPQGHAAAVDLLERHAQGPRVAGPAAGQLKGGAGMEAVLAVSAALGACVGLILGLTGAGGAIMAVPLLVFGLHLQVAQAAPIALLAVGLAAALGAALGLRAGKVRYRAAGFIAATGIVVSPLGLWAARRLPNAPLAVIFAGVLGWVAWRMWRGGQPAAAEAPAHCPPCLLNADTGRLRWTAPCARALGGTGVAAGFLSGLLGVGAAS